MNTLAQNVEKLFTLWLHYNLHTIRSQFWGSYINTNKSATALIKHHCNHTSAIMSCIFLVILYILHYCMCHCTIRHLLCPNSRTDCMFLSLTRAWQFQLSKQDTSCGMLSWLICCSREHWMSALSKRSFLPNKRTTNIPSLYQWNLFRWGEPERL